MNENVNIAELHQASLVLAERFAQAYAENSPDALDILEEYKEARRKLPQGWSGRYGAAEAYAVTQGQ